MHQAAVEMNPVLCTDMLGIQCQLDCDAAIMHDVQILKPGGFMHIFNPAAQIKCMIRCPLI